MDRREGWELRLAEKLEAEQTLTPQERANAELFRRIESVAGRVFRYPLQGELFRAEGARIDTLLRRAHREARIGDSGKARELVGEAERAIAQLEQRAGSITPRRRREAA